MKTKLKRVSRSTLAVILAIMMLFSTMLVGTISVSATTTTYYLWYCTGSKDVSNVNYTMVPNNIISLTQYQAICFLFNTDSSDVTKDTVWGNSEPSMDNIDYSAVTDKLNWNGKPQSSKQGDYGIYKLEAKTAFNLKITYDGSKVTLSEAGSEPTPSTQDYRLSGTVNNFADYNGSTQFTDNKITLTNVSAGAQFKLIGYDTKIYGSASGSNLNIGSNGISNYTTAQSNNVFIFSEAGNYTVTLVSNAIPPVISVTKEATSTKSYALTGTLADGGTNASWDNYSSGLKFTTVDSNGYYSLDVTVSTEENSRFRITDSDGTSYVPEKSGTDITQYTSSTNACSTFVRQKTENSNRDYYFTFKTKGTYTVKLDVSGSTPKIWVETSGASDGAITLKDSTPVNGSLSFSAPGKANVGDTVTITAKPFNGFTCDKITVTYTATAGTAQTQDLTVSNNTASFTVPDVKADAKGAKTITFEASFTLNKENYLSNKGEGLWIDVAPEQNDSTATLIKWNNYYDYNQNTSTNPYTFYVPKNVDLSNAKIYNGYSGTVTVNGTQIGGKSFNTVNLSVSDNISVTGAYQGKIKVMQGSTNAMFLYTTKNGAETALRTKTYADWNADASSVSKSDEKTDGGSCKTMTNTSTTADFSAAMSLESVKGRGNSSWEASAKRFGKYAYNMKLADKTTLFGMATDTKNAAGSKSWCLLANNADESMLRNALAYQLAADVGLYSSPEFSFVDIYDNGEYLGQYLVTEKVDVGSSKLINGKSIEDINEDAHLVFDEKSKNEVNNATYTKNDKTYTYSYCYTTETTGAASPDISKATYLLEFEIEERYKSEPCWFTTPQGQHVVVKSPEFATQDQVKYIAEKFIEMEAAVFGNSLNSTLSNYIDLDSFARMYLLQELSSNLDAASTSYYVTYDCSKGSNARFVASPVWDYDWAFGQYKGLGKYDVDGNSLNPQATDAWFAKNKKYDDSSYKRDKKYSIQSKLANNSDFQKVIKKVWNGTESQEGFYAKVKKFYTGEKSTIDIYYDKISASVNMNETRWHIIAGDRIEDWGSADTGDTHADAVNYLENQFLSPRASWLNTEINKFDSYTQIAAPTLKAYDSTGKTELTGDVAVGDSVVLKATTSEIFVTYRLYQGDTLVDSNTTGKFTVKPASAGTFTYKVETVYGESNVKTSNDVIVTATGEAAPVLNSVALSAPSTTTVGASITLTANADVTGSSSGISYKYYMSNDNTVSEDDTLIKTTETTSCTTYAPSTANTYYYYVVATLGEQTATSELAQVIVTEEVGKHDVIFHFKSSSAYPYKPTATIDGKAYTMEKGSTCLGTIYTGVLSIYWYSVTVNIDSKVTHTLKFTTASTSMNAEMTDKFSGDEYYFAVDNLVNGTEIVDLTNKDEYIRNYFHTPTHMVDSTDYSDGSLGFTYVTDPDTKIGKTYRMCTYVDNGSTYSIDSVTAIQKSCAGLLSTSSLQTCLFDANLDGAVDINDATLLQKALAQ